MPRAPDPGINYNPTARQMPAWAEEMLTGYLANAGLDRVFINSTMRTPEEQASAMFYNETHGQHIRYGATGTAVLALVDPNDRDGSITAMADKIREFGAAGKVVSYHCDGPDGFTAADLDPTSLGGIGSSSYTNFLDVLRAAKDLGELKELLSPDVGKGNAGYDPAVHVVFVQGTFQREAASIETYASGGDSASYEGDDSGTGPGIWTIIAGGILSTVAYKGGQALLKRYPRLLGRRR